MNAYFLEHIRSRRADPGTDLTSKLVQAEVDGERLADEEIVGFVGLLLLAGHITTTATLGNSVLSFQDNPDAAAEVRADPALLPAAIEEVLRVRTPFPRLARITTVDTEVGGVRIPAGQIVLPWLAAANRDERVFADPDRFDVHRKPNPHLSFGHGIHFCLGAPLARLEARVALRLLLRALPRHRGGRRTSRSSSATRGRWWPSPGCHCRYTPLDRARRHRLPGGGPGVPQRRRRLDQDTGRYRPLSAAQKQVNAAHARQRGPGERVNAELKNWRILRKIRSCRTTPATSSPLRRLS